MASLVASGASAVVVEDSASPSRVVAPRSTIAQPASAAAVPATISTLPAALARPQTSEAINVALPARSASFVRIAGLAVLCAATLVAPALLLVWMPIVLGVPHIASDIRFLVLPLPRRQAVVSIAACALLVALKAISLVFGVALLRVEMIIVGGWLLVMLALARSTRRSHALQRHANPSRASSLPVVLGAFGAMAIIALPIQFAIVAAFAHNFVAVVAWIVVKRPARRHALAVIGTIIAAVAVLVLLGPALATMTGGITSPWLTIDKAASVMFGGVPLPTARGLMIAFAFLQAVHYAIWLDWVPRGASRMASTPWLLVVAGTLAVVAAAMVSPAWARTTYLALATFHIYLELVVLAARAARRRA
jgi:hypothetical protein